MAKQPTIRGLRSVPLDDQQRALLVHRRRELGLSQQRLADQLRCRQISIHNIEAGKTQPTPTMLRRICDILNLEFDVSIYVYLRPKRAGTQK
jgi:transcriptional regulator with XRE-family HTH domain